MDAKKLTFEQAKDQIAKKYGYETWESGENAMLTHISNVDLISVMTAEAAELYAESCAKDAVISDRKMLRESGFFNAPILPKIQIKKP